MESKEEVMMEINRLIEILEDVCGVDQTETIERLRELVALL